MEAKAYLKYVRISPRKVKIVLDLISGKDTDVAMAILKNTPKLYVSECFVCPGPTLKRVQPRAQGRAFSILKRTSHVTLVVKEKEVG